MPKKKSGMKTAALTGIALAGLAGAYFLYGSKDAAKNRKKVHAWMLKAKADVMDKLAKTKDLSQEKFHTIVDEAAQKYGSKVKDFSPEDVAAYAKSLKKHWKDLKKSI